MEDTTEYKVEQPEVIDSTEEKNNNGMEGFTPDFSSLFSSGNYSTDYKPIFEMQSKIFEQQDNNIEYLNNKVTNLENYAKMLGGKVSALTLILIIEFLGILAVIIFK